MPPQDPDAGVPQGGADATPQRANPSMRRRGIAAAVAMLVVAAACGTVPRTAPERPRAAASAGEEVVFYALGLIDTGYRYGGKNPEAGLDCSGMVSHIFAQAAGRVLTGSAADMARLGRAVERPFLRGGDLVFFNTLGRPFSHVGIYIGGNRFVHAPSTNGRVRIESLETEYFARRFEGGRAYFD